MLVLNDVKFRKLNERPVLFHNAPFGKLSKSYWEICVVGIPVTTQASHAAAVSSSPVSDCRFRATWLRVSSGAHGRFYTACLFLSGHKILGVIGVHNTDRGMNVHTV
jgi:hypothetical protein